MEQAGLHPFQVLRRNLGNCLLLCRQIIIIIIIIGDGSRVVLVVVKTTTIVPSMVSICNDDAVYFVFAIKF